MATHKVDILADLYIPLLESLDIRPNDEGGLYRDDMDGRKKVVIAKRDLVLPTPENLKSLDNEKVMAFHPLSENVARGDSQVQKYLKDYITLILSLRFALLSDSLLRLAANKNYHDSFNSNQLELLQLFPDIDEKAVANYTSAIEESFSNSSSHFIKIYNKRNGKINDVAYNRVATVSFPLLEQINNPEKSEIWGVSKMRKRDLKLYKQLFEYILPNHLTENAWSGFSDSMQAPSFQALMYAFVKVQMQFNYFVEKYKSLFEKFEELNAALGAGVNLSYHERLNQLSKYDGLIPPLDGNIGPTDLKQANTTPVKAPPAVPPSSALKLPAVDINTNYAEPSVPQTQQQFQQPAMQPAAPVQQPVQAPPPPVPQQQFVPGQNQQWIQPTIPQPQGFYPQPQQGWGQPTNGGYIQPKLYPTPQQQFWNQQQAWQQQQVANDPVAQWNASTAPAMPAVGYGWNAQPQGWGVPVQPQGFYPQPQQGWGQPAWGVQQQQPRPHMGFKAKA